MNDRHVRKHLNPYAQPSSFLRYVQHCAVQQTVQQAVHLAPVILTRKLYAKEMATNGPNGYPNGYANGNANGHANGFANGFAKHANGAQGSLGSEFQGKLHLHFDLTEDEFVNRTQHRSP